LSNFTIEFITENLVNMMNETVEKIEIDEVLVGFNGPEDDEDDFDNDDFDLEIDTIGGGFDFDEEDEDF